MAIRKNTPKRGSKSLVETTKTSTRLDPNAVLSGVVVRFDTTSDDKDDDTVLSVALKNKSGTVVAKAGGITGHWDNNSTNFVTLFITLQSTRKQLDGTSSLEVHIEPNGNDTWAFNCIVIVSFSDGIQTQATFNDHWLSQDNKTNSYPFPIAQ